MPGGAVGALGRKTHRTAGFNTKLSDRVFQHDFLGRGRLSEGLYCCKNDDVCRYSQNADAFHQCLFHVNRLLVRLSPSTCWRRRRDLHFGRFKRHVTRGWAPCNDRLPAMGSSTTDGMNASVPFSCSHQRVVLASPRGTAVLMFRDGQLSVLETSKFLRYFRVNITFAASLLAKVSVATSICSTGPSVIGVSFRSTPFSFRCAMVRSRVST